MASLRRLLHPSARNVGSATSVWTGQRARQEFVKYFVDQGHSHVPSSPLVPFNDKSLMFTNAGMVQFKQNFIDPSSSPHHAAVSVQRCVRAGGKHNDLDNEGYTPRHHTFFEMLGNFSFGKYGKEEAISLAWAFLTVNLKLPRDRLKATVLKSDKESLEIWLQKIGLPRSSVVALDEADNWWSMGDTGPCGPCTEIFWDNGSNDPQQWLEIWNIVFMQHLRRAEDPAKLADLDTLCIDTGMGLERVLSVLQGHFDNYQTDLFQPLLRAIHRGSANRNADPALAKIAADHVKSSAFLMGDGVVPSSIGRGYVLRKIIRRGARAALALGGPRMSTLVPTLLETYPGSQFPNLHARALPIIKMLEQEEEVFLSLLSRAETLVNAELSALSTDALGLDAERVFQLYGTHGVPMDVVEMLAQQRGKVADIAGAQRLLDEHREVSSTEHAAAGVAGTNVRDMEIVQSEFVGYDNTSCESEVTQVEPTGDPHCLRVVVDPCPFYALGGGQESDAGVLIRNGEYPCQAIPESCGGTSLLVDVSGNVNEPWLPGTPVTARVDEDARERIAVHHSATHLLHHALREVLGPHVTQAGSVVARDKLTFDITHPKPISTAQLTEIQRRVNAWAGQLAPTHIENVPLKVAQERGAIMAFSEKYGEHVRMVRIGPSLELCCGTHIANTRSVLPFVIMAEKSVSAGTRRIEAVSGRTAVEHLTDMQQTMHAATKVLPGTGNNTSDLVQRIDRLRAQMKQTERQLETTVSHLAQFPVGEEKRFGEWTVLLIPPSAGEVYLKRRVGILRQSIQSPTLLALGNQVAVLVPATGNRSAKAVVQGLIAKLGGSGGGSTTLAMAKLEREPLLEQFEENLFNS